MVDKSRSRSERRRLGTGFVRRNTAAVRKPPEDKELKAGKGTIMSLVPPVRAEEENVMRRMIFSLLFLLFGADYGPVHLRGPEMLTRWGQDHVGEIYTMTAGYGEGIPHTLSAAENSISRQKAWAARFPETGQATPKQGRL